MAQKISTFDDWTDYFNKWQKDIGFDASHIKNYNFDAFYADSPHGEIEFGEFKGRKKWEKLLDVPTQEMRDALMHLIVYQGDTEFASTEQQRKSPAKCADRLRSPIPVARHARRTTSWLADVLCPGQQLR